MSCALRLVAAIGHEPSVRPAPFSAGSLTEAARLEAPGGVYAVFSTWHGRRVVRLGHHLDRLRDSAHRLGIDSFELSADLLRREVCLVMDEAGIAEGKVRLSVHPDDPRSVLVAIEPYPGPPVYEREHGVACMTRARSARDNPLAKQTDWLKTRDTFTADGVYEWLLTDSRDRVLEGSSSNFYAIVDDPAGGALLQTAGDGVLSGIARSIVLEVASSEVPVSLVPVRTDRLASLREAFMSSSTRGIVPIVRIDGRDVGNGVPGPITRRLMHRYDERALELAEPLCTAVGVGAGRAGATDDQQTRLVQALDQARAEAEEQAQEAEALRMAGAIVASTLDVDRTVQLVLDQALNVVPYDTATVQLLRGNELEVIGGNGWDDLSAIVGLRIPCPGNNPHSAAIEHRSPTVYGDLMREFPAFTSIGGTTISSWLGIPLIVHDEVIGLLALDSTSIDFFTAKQIRLAAA
ncbi:MAG: GAF domain-containing protein, partial [Spirochaetaceae bacterium]